jgi:hypothetical protein
MGKRPRQHRDPNGSTKNQKTRGVLDIPILDTTAQKAAAHSGSTNEITVADEAFDLERFERLVYSRYKPDIETAFGMLVGVLRQMHLSRGDVPQGILCSRISEALPEMDRLSALWTRLSTAFLTLFLNPAFEALNDDGFRQLLTLKPQLLTALQASVINNVDACIEAFNLTPDSETFSVPMDDLHKVLLLYSLDSRYEPTLIYGFANLDASAVIDTCIALCSSIFCGTELAYRRRNEMLRYLCEQLRSHQLSERSLIDATASVYMHCSYADSPDKHAIKGLLHQQWRRLLAEHGISDLCAPASSGLNAGAKSSPSEQPAEKPTILILHEWMRSGCAMNRCYANWIASLRHRFHTVGMGLKESTVMDPDAIALFDDYVALPEQVATIEQVRSVHAWCRKHHPAIVYYPSIGMGVHTVAAASIRLAPLQVMTQGHPATTGGSCVDVLVTSADYARIDDRWLLDQRLITEKLELVPQGSMIWQTPAQKSGPSHDRAERQRIRAAQPSLIPQIVISASPMKLGAPFLKLCSHIWNHTKGKAFWHFFVADTRGALHMEVARTIQNHLGKDCMVYPHLNYKDYLEALEVGDIFLTPFPFGNSNTLYDYCAAGLIGVNLMSGELSCCVDTSLFHRLGFPSALIAADVGEYAEIAIRLILGSDWRQEMHRQAYVSGVDHHALFSSGDARKFADTMAELLRGS